MSETTKRETRLQRLERELEEAKAAERAKAAGKISVLLEKIEVADRNLLKWQDLLDRYTEEVRELEELLGAGEETPAEADARDELVEA